MDEWIEAEPSAGKPVTILAAHKFFRIEWLAAGAPPGRAEADSADQDSSNQVVANVSEKNVSNKRNLGEWSVFLFNLCYVILSVWLAWTRSSNQAAFLISTGWYVLLRSWIVKLTRFPYSNSKGKCWVWMIHVQVSKGALASVPRQLSSMANSPVGYTTLPVWVILYQSVIRIHVCQSHWNYTLTTKVKQCNTLIGHYIHWIMLRVSNP